MTALLAARSTATELMDDPAFGDAALRAAVLADLARLNRWSGTHRPVLAFLRRAWAREPAERTLDVLDVGSGQGDLLRAVHALALRMRRRVRLVGIDLSHEATAAARASTPAALPLRFETCDLFDWAEPADYVVSAQVAHHLDDRRWLRFVARIATLAQRGWCVTDLRRHALPWIAFPWLARAAGLHRVVRLDGTLSIARSHTPAEWNAGLAILGLHGVAVQRHWPFRMAMHTPVAQ